MVQIRWTRQAVEDLKNIADYIAKDSKVYAKRQIYKIRTKVKILQQQKQVGRIVPEIGNPHIRELIEGNYRIIYKIVADNVIDILTIHHSSRDLTRRRKGIK